MAALAAATLGTDLMVDVWNERAKNMDGLAVRPTLESERSEAIFAMTT